MRQAWHRAARPADCTFTPLDQKEIVSPIDRNCNNLAESAEPRGFSSSGTTRHLQQSSRIHWEGNSGTHHERHL